MAKLEHPHIVPLFDYWRDEQTAALVMRWLPGGSLRNSLEKGPLSLESVRQILEQVGAALALAHENNVVHRDLKPDNILVDSKANYYLTDFGIAKDLRGIITGDSSLGHVTGTPAYLSPEQGMGKEVTHQSDIYSLGVVLYELLTGEHPFPEADPTTQILHHISDSLPRVSAKREDLPTALDTVIEIATAKNPGQRYDSIEQLLRAFREASGLIGDESSQTVPGILEKKLGVKPYRPGFLEEPADQVNYRHDLFIGRERHLARLDEFLQKALAGETQIVFVTGEAGRGKTALIQEFTRRAESANENLIVAHGASNLFAGVADPYLPFRQVLSMLTGNVETQLQKGKTSRTQAIRLWNLIPTASKALITPSPDLIDSFISGRELAERAAGFSTAGEPWQSQLSQLIHRKGSESNLGEVGRSQLHDQYINFLKQLSNKYPIIIVLDDLHWIDQASIGLLAAISQELRTCPILLIGAYREEEIQDRSQETHPMEILISEFKRRLGDVWINLEETTRGEDIAFIDDYLDSEPNQLGKAFRQQLFTRTDGHPLFTIELLRNLQEGGQLVLDENNNWVVAEDLNWDMLPAKVEGVIEERISRLEDELRDILVVASVEGEDFTAQVISRIQEIRERKILHTLSEELEKQHRLISEQGESQVGDQILSSYKFTHALFQQYLYNGISAGERRLLHGEIAGVLEELYAGHTNEIAVQLARHYVEAANDSKAIKYLLESGDKALLLYSISEALDYYQQALDLAKGTEAYVAVLEKRAKVLLALYRGKEAVADHDELLRYARENNEREKEIKYLLGLAQSYYVVALDSQEPDAAANSLEMNRSAYALARANDDKRSMVLGLLPIAMYKDFFDGNTGEPLVTQEELIACSQEALELSESLEDQDLILDTKINFSSVLLTGESPDETDRKLEELQLQLEGQNDRKRLHKFYFGLMWYYLNRGSFEKCAEVCTSATKLSHEIGIPPVQYPTIKALAYFSMGKFTEARQSLDEEIADDEHPFGTAFKNWGTGQYLLSILDYSTAAKTFKTTTDQARKLQRLWMVRSSTQLEAWALALSGNLKEDELNAIKQNLAEINSEIPALIMAEVDHAAGKLESALSNADSAAREADKDGMRGDYISALEVQLRTLLELKRYKDVLSLVDRGIQIAHATNFLTMLWRLYVAKALALDSTGNDPEAQKAYLAASEIIMSLGESIEDQKAKKGFFANPQVAAVIEKTLEYQNKG